MTKPAKLRIILHILDWNEDLQACENGPVTAQAIADFDSEYDWGTVSYGDAVIAWVEAAGMDLATVTVADQGWLAGLVEGMYFTGGESSMSKWWRPDASSQTSVEDQILNRTDEWHAGGLGTDCSLYRYLGMTFHEGKRWVETGVYPQHLITNDIKPGPPEMNEYFRQRLNAALIELTHHGDLTPSGKRALERIISGER